MKKEFKTTEKDGIQVRVLSPENRYYELEWMEIKWSVEFSFHRIGIDWVTTSILSLNGILLDRETDDSIELNDYILVDMIKFSGKQMLISHLEIDMPKNVITIS